MMRVPAAVLALVALLALQSPVASSAADSCFVPKTAYDTGGNPARGMPMNDPLLPKQWGLQQIRAAEAWKSGALGKGAIVAVVDTGVDLRHPDLRKNLIKGADFVTEPPHCPGPHDQGAHGTHVAGIAAAVGNNGLGVVGVAPAAHIMPVRVLPPAGGLETLADAARTSARIAKGIRFAAKQGADVINLSLTSSFVTDIPIEPGGDTPAAIEYARSQGAVVVAAAGNNLLPLCDYPANDAGVICVAATDVEERPTFYSNQPNKTGSGITVRAPGGAFSTDCEDGDQDIWSTVLPDDFDCEGTRGYDTYAGTSMATPHVVGVIALLMAEGLSNDEAIECLQKTSRNPITGQRGEYDPVYGYGIVDAGHAVVTCTN